MALLAKADIVGAMGAAAYARVFNRDGTTDDAFVATRIALAESWWRLWTKAAFPDAADVHGSVVDPAILNALIDLACYAATYKTPGANGSPGGPYRQGYLDAQALAKALTRDADARPDTAYAGARARPRAVITNTTDASNVPTNPYGRAADRKDGSGF